MAYGADGTLGANSALLNLAGFGFIGALNNVTTNTGAGGNNFYTSVAGNSLTIGGYVTVEQALTVAGTLVAQGPLQLNNAYVAGTIPTTAGYLTIQDKTGTTYFVPVGTAA